jgi:catechol 2,3-dioxygenase-like lactoylglutathione lyase family enzyme
MSIIGVDQITYGVEDRDTCRRFWLDFGLALVDDTPERTLFETAEGTCIELRDAGDAGLPAALIEGATGRETIWGVDDQTTLESIADELSTDRDVGRDDGGTLHSTDADGYGIGFRLSARRPLPENKTLYNSIGSNDRIDARATVYDRATPQRIAHAVFLVGDIQAMVSFYRDRLGFVTTDRYPSHGHFLRCDGASEHHNLFLLDGKGTMGLHHVAFEVRDIHEVFGGGCHMDSLGWETHLGPGRHPISSAYFWYFRNPCGGAAEYDADTDVVTDDWQPRVFEPTPESFAEWALADGINKYGGTQTIKIEKNS